jgi:hypothetical protein
VAPSTGRTTVTEVFTHSNPACCTNLARPLLMSRVVVVPSALTKRMVREERGAPQWCRALHQASATTSANPNDCRATAADTRPGEATTGARRLGPTDTRSAHLGSGSNVLSPSAASCHCCIPDPPPSLLEKTTIARVDTIFFWKKHVKRDKKEQPMRKAEQSANGQQDSL